MCIMGKISRRNFTVAIATLSTASLSGCLGLFGDDEPNTVDRDELTGNNDDSSSEEGADGGSIEFDRERDEDDLNLPEDIEADVTFEYDVQTGPEGDVIGEVLDVSITDMTFAEEIFVSIGSEIVGRGDSVGETITVDDHLDSGVEIYAEATYGEAQKTVRTYTIP